MKIFEVKPGAEILVFTEESVLQSKGRKVVAKGGELFSEILIDPISVANGRDLDPEFYLEGFPHKMWKATRKGYYIFQEGGEDIFAIHHTDLKMANGDRETWMW